MGIFSWAGDAVDAFFGDTSGLEQDIGGAIGGESDFASEALSQATSSAFDNIGSLIKDVSSTVKDLINPLADVVHNIASTIKDINDNIIQPIVKPIQAVMDTTQTLIKVLHSDLSNGFKGLLQLSQDVTNAVTGFDATMQRTVAALGASNAKLMSESVVPAIGSSGKVPLDAMSIMFKSALTGMPDAWKQPAALKLGGAGSLEGYRQYLASMQEEINANETTASILFNVMMRGLNIITFMAAQAEPYIDLAREEAFEGAATKRLDASTVALLRVREEITDEEAIAELRAQGFNQTRAESLLNAAITPPGNGDLIAGFRRGILDAATVSKRLQLNGLEESDVNLLLSIGTWIPDVNLLLAMVRQGMLDGEALEAALLAQGMTLVQFTALAQAANVNVSVADAALMTDRAGVAGVGVDVSDNASAVPDAVLKAAQVNGVSVAAVAAQWSNHWQLLPPALAVQAFFRGYINRTQLDSLLNAAAILKDHQQNYIDLQRPLISFRTITSMLAAGLITDLDARQHLTAHGFTDSDAIALIEYAQGKSKAAAPTIESALHGLTQGTVIKLYEAGTITPDVAHSMLVTIGIGDEAATLALQLSDLNAQHADRKAETDLILAEASTGVLTFEQAQGELNALGLTDTETKRALTTMLRAQRKATKLPSESQLAGMFKHGIIDEATYHDTLVLLGFSEDWTQAIIALTSSAPLPKPEATP